MLGTKFKTGKCNIVIGVEQQLQKQNGLQTSLSSSW